MARIKEITSNDDIIDSRDIIERIKELRGATEPEEIQELEKLEEFAINAEDYAEDWEYGAQFIRESYFKEYAQELAEDIGAIDRKAQ